MSRCVRIMEWGHVASIAVEDGSRWTCVGGRAGCAGSGAWFVGGKELLCVGPRSLIDE